MRLGKIWHPGNACSGLALLVWDFILARSKTGKREVCVLLCRCIAEPAMAVFCNATDSG